VRIPIGPSLTVVAAALAAPSAASGQAAITSDLWRVAEGTLVVPAALASDGSAALWTPATALADRGPSMKVGVEAIHAPADVGLTGGVATLAVRLGRIGTLNAVYGRMGVDGLVRTETSPQSMGDIPVYAEVVSLGLARQVSSALLAGVAVRSMNGQLDVQSHGQVGVDFGLRYTTRTRFTFALATRFFDPTLGQAETGASYNLAAGYRSGPLPMWGASGVVAFRYGATLSRGEGVQHLLSAGLALGGVMDMDVGASREVTAGVAVWRSRFGLGLEAGRYRVYLGRDGGVNGFGATYRFGLSAGLR
jgi:hypothetical protein